MVPTPKTTVVLAVIAALTTGWLYFFERKFETTDEHAIAERRILHVHADQIHSIRLKRDVWTSAAVERVDAATFRRTEPTAGAVDSAAILQLCFELEFLDHETTLPGWGLDSQHLYEEGLNPPHLVVTLTLADHREIEFTVGKETPTADGAYLRVRDDSKVQIVSKAFAAQLDQLLDKLQTDMPEGAKPEGVPVDQEKPASGGPPASPPPKDR